MPSNHSRTNPLQLLAFLAGVAVLFLAGCVTGRLAGFADETLVGQDRQEILRLAFAKCERRAWPDGKEAPAVLVNYQGPDGLCGCHFETLEQALAAPGLMVASRWDIVYHFQSKSDGSRTEFYREIEFRGEKAVSVCSKRHEISPQGCWP